MVVTFSAQRGESATEWRTAGAGPPFGSNTRSLIILPHIILLSRHTILLAGEFSRKMMGRILGLTRVTPPERGPFFRAGSAVP
jgi:hypothetical protein